MYIFNTTKMLRRSLISSEIIEISKLSTKKIFNFLYWKQRGESLEFFS